MGNATTNGAVILWVGIDWIRFIIRNYDGFSLLLILKILLCLITIGYSCLIIYEGVKGRTLVKYIGRIRVVSYFILVLSPVIYNLIKPDWKYFLAILIFFPVYYYLIELVDHITPDPKTITGGEDESRESSSISETPSSLSSSKSSSDENNPLSDMSD